MLEPRDREVGRVLAVARRPHRRDQLHERLLLRLERPVGHVALHLPPALVGAVGPLAEAEEALGVGGLEANAHGLSSVRLGLEPDHTLAIRLDAEADLPRGVGCGERTHVGGALAPRVDDSGGVEPARGRSEPERSRGPRAGAGVLAQRGAGGSVRERQSPRVGIYARPERTGIDDLGRVRLGREKCNQHEDGDHERRARHQTLSVPAARARQSGYPAAPHSGAAARAHARPPVPKARLRHPACIGSPAGCLSRGPSRGGSAVENMQHLARHHRVRVRGGSFALALVLSLLLWAAVAALVLSLIL